MRTTLPLCLAMAATLGAAVLANAFTHTVCRIQITTTSGNVYIAGEGDDLQAAMLNAKTDTPDDWRIIEFPGCYK